MRKVIFKERATGATSKALSWLFEGKYKWVYIVPTTTAKKLVLIKLMEHGLDSRLKEWVITERQLVSMRGHRFDRIVLDELGYFKKPLKTLWDILVYSKPITAEKSDIYITIGKESCQHMVRQILEEVLGEGIKFE